MKKNSNKKPETFLELKAVDKNKIIKKSVHEANIQQKKIVDLALTTA